MTFSIIVPTCGRASLKRALNSVQGQLADGDEVMVIGDGEQPKARAICEAMKERRLRYLEHGPTRNWGNSQRNYAIGRARGDYLLFLDDDDRYVPGALDQIRRAVREFPDRPFLFRFIAGQVRRFSLVLWEKPDVKKGNVGTPCIAFPNDPARLGDWSERYEGDYDFIASTLALYPPNSVAWRQHIVQDARR